VVCVCALCFCICGLICVDALEIFILNMII
jgi:hypothetical protein